MLAVCWSATGEHIGEVLRVSAPGPKAGWVFGRDSSPKEEQGRLFLTRRRPGALERRPFESPYVSRVQLVMRATDEGIDVQSLGKRRLIADNGSTASRILVRPGETLEIEDQILFVCVSQPAELPSATDATLQQSRSVTQRSAGFPAASRHVTHSRRGRSRLRRSAGRWSKRATR